MTCNPARRCVGPSSPSFCVCNRLITRSYTYTMVYTIQHRTITAILLFGATLSPETDALPAPAEEYRWLETNFPEAHSVHPERAAEAEVRVLYRLLARDDMRTRFFS